jgi:RNA polymerase sigma factor (sigma-70 family)
VPGATRAQEGTLVEQQQLESTQVEATAAEVRGIAARFLERWTDPMTVNLVDDLAQVTTLDTLAWCGRLCEPRCLPGFVRTIARRVRCKILRRERGRCDSANDPFPNDVPSRRREVVKLHVAARWVERDQLLPWLDDALDNLPPLNSRLLREFYGGTSCRDLAARYQLTPDTVKMRLHRSRERVRASLERRVSLSLV